MTDTQGEMFGEVGGLFGPDTIPTTPLDQLDLPREIAPGVILAPIGDEDRAHEPAPEILGPCQTCGEPVTNDDGGRTRYGLLHDGCNEPDDTDPDDGPDWTPDNPPRLADLAEHVAPWLILGVIEAADHAAAAELLRRTLASSGFGESRGHVTGSQRGYHLGTHDDGPLLARWRDLAEVIRDNASDDDTADLADAMHRLHEIDAEDERDPRPWTPAHTLAQMSTGDRQAHDRADAAWHLRNERRLRARVSWDAQARTVIADVVARIRAAGTAGQLF